MSHGPRLPIRYRSRCLFPEFFFSSFFFPSSFAFLAATFFLTSACCMAVRSSFMYISVPLKYVLLLSNIILLFLSSMTVHTMIFGAGFAHFLSAYSMSPFYGHLHHIQVRFQQFLNFQFEASSILSLFFLYSANDDVVLSFLSICLLFCIYLFSRTL